MDKGQALYSFWSSFGIPAYDAYSVPDDATLPYITFTVSDGSFGDYDHQMTASLWYRSTSWADIEAKKNAISTYIGSGGQVLAIQDGAIWIKRGSTFAQRMDDPNDDKVKRYLLQVEVDFFTID